MEFLRFHKNDLFDKVVEKGLSPSLFEVEVGDNNDHIRLKVKDENFRFQVSSITELLNVSYFPKKDGNYVSINFKEDQWNSVLYYFSDWLENIKPNIIQPDKWAEYFNNKEFINFDYTDSSNSLKFTNEEVIQIECAVNKIKSEINSLGFDDKKIDEINSKLNYLVDRAKTSSRIDWKNIFIGTLISIPVQLALTEQNVKAFYHICKLAFNFLFLPK